MAKGVRKKPPATGSSRVVRQDPSVATIVDKKPSAAVRCQRPGTEREKRARALAAVKRCWVKLGSVDESCRSDREIVLAAVQQHGFALQYAAESCKSDREIVLAAVQNDIIGLLFASDALLEDTSFAADAKKHVYILRISLMS
eukprot:3880339-Amphidinium_carterae.1